MVTTVSAIFSIGYGVAGLVVPEAIGSIFGITYDTAAVYAGRLLGGSYVGYGIANFLSRDTVDPQTRRALAAGNAFAWAVGFVVSTAAQLQGLVNAIGWSSVVLTVAFTVAWAWAYASAGVRGPAAHGAPAR
jgi:hypothetical protein